MTHEPEGRAQRVNGRGRGAGSLALAAALSCAMLGETPSALAEGGSIGGNIGGSTGGSIGGNIGETSKPAPAARPAQRVAQPPVVQRQPRAPQYVRAPRPERTARRTEGGGRASGSYDGVWSLSTASSCGGSGTGVFRVSGSRLAGGAGSVSPSGVLYASDRVNGYRNTYSGRLSGNSGGGTYQRNDGCSGQWSASRG